MTISRIELQGQVTRAQDFTTIKQNEDQKGIVDQSNFQTQINHNIEQHLHQVRRGDAAENQNKKFDAKEEGSGTYSGDGGKHRNKKEKEDGKVILKGQSGFDIKI